MIFQENVQEINYPGQLVKVYGWAGEPKHDQPSRPDPNNQISKETKTYWRSQPFIPPINLTGVQDLNFPCAEDEANFFVIQVMLDGKPDVVSKHVEDGVINWAGVAGENDNQHDHWVNAFGVVTINGFDRAKDRVFVTGHTVTESEVFRPRRIGPGAKRDITQFGPIDEDAMSVMIYSQQGGGGGAHDEDLLGLIQFPDAAVSTDVRVETIRTTVGVADTWDEFEALVEAYKDREVSSSSWLEFDSWVQSEGMDINSFTSEQRTWLFSLYVNYVKGRSARRP